MEVAEEEVALPFFSRALRALIVVEDAIGRVDRERVDCDISVT